MTKHTKIIVGAAAAVIYMTVAGMTMNHATGHCAPGWQSDRFCAGGTWPMTAGAAWPIYWPAHVGASINTEHIP